MNNKTLDEGIALRNTIHACDIELKDLEKLGGMVDASLNGFAVKIDISGSEHVFNLPYSVAQTLVDLLMMHYKEQKDKAKYAFEQL